MCNESSGHLKRLYPTVFLLTVFASFSPLLGQTTDTVFGRNPNYYYYSWYDECFRYQDDTNDFDFRTFMMSMDAESRMMVSEQYVPGALTLKGVAVMTPIEMEQDVVHTQFMPFCDSLKMPEYVYVYQGGGLTPGVSSFWYPRQLTLLDSVRWDTAAPKVMALPTTAEAAATDDTSQMLYCYVYEAYFETPVTVWDTFYLGGTYKSNATQSYYDTLYNERGAFEIMRDRFLHYPTEYVCVRDYYTDECNKCLPQERLFFPFIPLREDLMECYGSWPWSVSGPFIPIVRR